LFTPLGPVGRWLPPAPPTIPTTAQLALFSTFDPFAAAQAPQGAAAAAPAVSGFTLFGTRMSLGGAPGSAIIAGADGIQNSYSVGDEVAPGVRLLSVGFDFVLVGGNGAEQRLAMEGADPPAAATPAAAALAPAAQTSPSPPPPSATMSHFAPRLVGGRVSGFLVSPLRRPAVLAAAGLRDGDIITQVNGRPLDRPRRPAIAAQPRRPPFAHR
jgi:general secretion pathway protein C